MSALEKRTLQSSQMRVRTTLHYHVTRGVVTTATLRGGRAVTSLTDRGSRLRLDVINGVTSVNLAPSELSK